MSARISISDADQVAALTRRAPHAVTVADLVRDALRMRPDRIVIGEIRDGAAALETLKAWNTGHPGGLTTIHANSAAEAINRLEDLIGEVATKAPTRLIEQSLDVVVFIRRTADGRRVEEIVVRKA
jgi:Flp pilus assembly CpaF family ATPase